MTIAQFLVFPLLIFVAVDARQTMLGLPRGHEELNPIVGRLMDALGPDRGLAVGICFIVAVQLFLVIVAPGQWLLIAAHCVDAMLAIRNNHETLRSVDRG